MHMYMYMYVYVYMYIYREMNLTCCVPQSLFSWHILCFHPLRDQTRKTNCPRHWHPKDIASDIPVVLHLDFYANIKRPQQAQSN